MHHARRTIVAALVLAACAATAHAEILVRWEQDDVLPSHVLGVTTLVLPAGSTAGIRNALAAGYRVFVEIDAARAAGFLPPANVAGVIVTGEAAPGALQQLRARVKERGMRAAVLEQRVKWPHIRSNWVTKNKEVLQVAGRSAQPWLENNAALVRIARAASPEAIPLLTYVWQPNTVAELEAGPQPDDYLVAIAEAGSFGADLVLPLHETLQKELLLGRPEARETWEAIRRHIEFFAWNLPARYEPLANVGVLTSEPMLVYEPLNLLARHNVPFRLLDPARLSPADTADLALVIAFESLRPSHVEALAAFAGKGGTLLVQERENGNTRSPYPWRKSKPVTTAEGWSRYTYGDGLVVEMPAAATADPNAFAMEVRQLLGRDRRPIDIWNGITVLTAAYKEPAGGDLLVTALNYAHQPLPVQIRVQGTFTDVRYESPDEPMTRLAFEHRDGGTEFVIPALRTGGRVFLKGPGKTP